MIYVVFAVEGMIGFVSQELPELLFYISNHRYHSIEMWRGAQRRGMHY